MKKLIFISILFIAFQNINAQEETKKGITESTFKVDGVCGMCEERIENAALRTSGVKLADWNKETKILKVTYKSSKVTEEEIQAAIAAVGHDTESEKAKDEVYEKIHPCCHYRDKKVQEDHKDQ